MQDILIVGRDPTPILKHLPDRYLMIDDGPIIDQVTFPAHYDVTRFDPTFHRINVLKDIDHKRARELSSVFYATDPGGESTLTVRNGKRALAALLLKAKSLDQVDGNTKDPAVAEALGLLDTILFSPVVKDILSDTTNLSFKGTVLARLNRAELGDEDCLVLGLILMMLYPGPIVVTDLGFYGRRHHIRLIRQKRLLSCIAALDERAELKSNLLLADTKIASRCTVRDAEELANTGGLRRDPDRQDCPYNVFIAKALTGVARLTVPESGFSFDGGVPNADQDQPPRPAHRSSYRAQT